MPPMSSPTEGQEVEGASPSKEAGWDPPAPPLASVVVELDDDEDDEDEPPPPHPATTATTTIKTATDTADRAPTMLIEIPSLRGAFPKAPTGASIYWKFPGCRWGCAGGCDSPRWVLGVSSRSWLAVTAMRRPGREGVRLSSQVRAEVGLTSEVGARDATPA